MTTAVRLGYVPALDGLRGLAVLLVMGRHFEVPFLQGGFLGVDLFFVLSGFLITCLLLEEWHGTDRLRLPSFYGRRLLRLKPAFMVTLTWSLAYAVFFAGNTVNLYTGVGFLVAPIFSPLAIPFLSTTPDIGTPLTPIWSLLIEETFYLVWPPLLFLLLTLRFHYGALVGLGIVLAAISAGLRVWLLSVGAAPGDIYETPIARADGLLIGCTVALLITRRPVPAWLSIAGARIAPGFFLALAVLIVVADPYNHAYLYQGGFTLLSVGVGAVIVHVLDRPLALLATALSFGPLVSIGRISYGLYLYHYPVYVLTASLGLPLVPQVALQTSLALAVATISYRFVEQPALRLKRHLSAGSRYPKVRLSPE